MADSKISALAEVTDFQATDELVLARASSTKKIKGSTILDASGMALISDTVLGADTASFDVQNIPQGYKHLMIELTARCTTAATYEELLMRLNNDSSGIYESFTYYFTSAGASGASDGGTTATSFDAGQIPAATADANKFGVAEIKLLDYVSSNYKAIQSDTSASRTTAAGQRVRVLGAGTWASTAAVSRITLLPGSGSLKAGSRLTLYGLGGTPSAVSVTSNLVNYLFSR